MDKHSWTDYGWLIVGALAMMILLSSTTPLVHIIAEAISAVFNAIGAFFGKFLSVIKQSEPTFSMDVSSFLNVA